MGGALCSGSQVAKAHLGMDMTLLRLALHDYLATAVRFGLYLLAIGHAHPCIGEQRWSLPLVDGRYAHGHAHTAQLNSFHAPIHPDM